jgi:hypothetical protein
MTLRPRLLAGAALVVALAPASAAGADDPSAYTDPAPRPIQDEQAAKDVQDELRREGVVTRVTPEQVRSGVVVIATPAPSGGGSSTPSQGGGGKKGPATRSAKALALTAKGLAPSVRSGVPRPQDPAVPEPVLLAVAAAALATWAALLALGRRRRITSL